MRIFGGTALVLLCSLSLAAQEDVAALVQRASGLIDQRRYPEALAVLDRCLAADDSQAGLHALRAFVMNVLGDHARAVEDASRAIELDPQDFRGFYQRGFGLHRQKDLARSLADYDRAIVLEPGIAALHGERGDLLRELDAPGAAVAAYDTAIELRPTWTEAYAGRARALNALTDYAAACRDLRRATELAPDVADFWWLRAHTEAQCGDDVAALRSADEFVRLQPDELRTWATGLRAYLAWDAGELDLAAELFTLAADESRDSPPRPRTAAVEVLLSLGYVQLAKGNLDAAATALESAARQGDPRQLGRARMMQWCIDARALGLDEAGRKLEERLGERLQELSPVERGLVGFCRTGDGSLVPGGLFPSEDCARSFLEAWRCDVAGDRAGAERSLRRCINTGSVDSKEWKNALLWLRSGQPDGLRSMLGAEIELTGDPAVARARVRSVGAGSAAELQGLRADDELLDLSGRPISREGWDALESRGRIGLALRVTRRRDGADEVLWIRLGVAPGVE